MMLELMDTCVTRGCRGFNLGHDLQQATWQGALQVREASFVRLQADTMRMMAVIGISSTCVAPLVLSALRPACGVIV